MNVCGRRRSGGCRRGVCELDLSYDRYCQTDKWSYWRSEIYTAFCEQDWCQKLRGFRAHLKWCPFGRLSNLYNWHQEESKYCVNNRRFGRSRWQKSTLLSKTKQQTGGNSGENRLAVSDLPRRLERNDSLRFAWPFMNEKHNVEEYLQALQEWASYNIRLLKKKWGSCSGRGAW
jgi:hypothetical protein